MRPSNLKTPDPSLAQVILVFLQYRSPQLLLTIASLCIGLRIWLGHFSYWDLAVIAPALLLQPFVEWLIHVFVLHFRPRSLFGLRLDLHAARKHRAHHRSPWQLDYVFIPIRTGFIGLAILAAMFYLAMPSLELFLTGLSWGVLMALSYEWIHYLIHTSYRPRTPFYRRRWKIHRLHHFKNEHFWMGVTGHLGDQVLGTLPSRPTEVVTSKTCRTLGVDDDESSSPG